MADFYMIDDENAAIRSIQTRLRAISKADLRISPVFVDGIYGSETEEAVRTFQRAYGLPVTGQVDFATHRAIGETYELMMRKNEDSLGSVDFHILEGGVISSGDRFDGVAELQLLLRALASQDDRFRIDADGFYGAETAEAVKLFQRLRGRDENAIVDILLWNELAEFAARPRGE